MKFSYQTQPLKFKLKGFFQCTYYIYNYGQHYTVLFKFSINYLYVLFHF